MLPVQLQRIKAMRTIVQITRVYNQQQILEVESSFRQTFIIRSLVKFDISFFQGLRLRRRPKISVCFLDLAELEICSRRSKHHQSRCVRWNP